MTAIELLRVGAALVPYGHGFTAPLYVVMSKDAPNEVAAIVQTEAEAIDVAVTRDNSFFVYGPFSPPNVTDYPRELDYVDPTCHDITDMWRTTVAAHAGQPGEKRHLKDVTAISLVITFRNGDRVSYDCNHHTDAIFVTRGAREAFIYPRYSSMFGTNHAQKIRERLNETTP